MTYTGTIRPPLSSQAKLEIPIVSPQEFTLNEKDLFPRGPFTLIIITRRDNVSLRRHSCFRLHPPPIGDEPDQADPTEKNANDQTDRGDRQQKHRRHYNDDHPDRERTSAVIGNQSSAQSLDKLHTGIDRDQDVRQ